MQGNVTQDNEFTITVSIIRYLHVYILLQILLWERNGL